MPNNESPEARFIAACRRHGLSPSGTFVLIADRVNVPHPADVAEAAIFLMIDVNTDSDIDEITDLLPDA